MTEPAPCCPTCASPLLPDVPGDLCPKCTFGSVVREEESSLEDEANVPKIEGIELQAEIGEGGFGIVYRARQVGVVRRKVALKVLKPGVDTRQVLRRFEVERQALAHLEHPAIARLYEAGQTKEGYPYFTMELVEGVPINEAVGGLTLSEVIDLFVRVCEAIGHAHDHGVMHRDLKPGNILVSGEGAPKVIDFGLAKALDAEQAPGMTLYTGGETWLGTPGYAAPEQLQASEIELDERADIYSLGAILYHLLTGMNPEDAREVAVKPDELPPPSEIALQTIKPGLDAIVMHALSADREKRYRSVRALIADLRRYLNGDDLSVQKVVQRPWKKYAIATVFALCLGLGWIIFSSSQKNLPNQPSQPSQPEQNTNDLIAEIEQDLTFEEIGFIELEEDEDPIPPFDETNGFCWVKFRKPDGGEFILSHDSIHESPTVTQFFIGGKRPDEPGVRVIPFDSPEDTRLFDFYLGLIEKVIGKERAEILKNTDWEDFHKNDINSKNNRMLKNLLGSVMFFKSHRNAREEEEDY